MTHIVLFQPQIPQNTGNIVRTCAVTGSTLTLIKPLGFSISSRHLRRAGLDYWNDVDIRVSDDLRTVIEKAQGTPYFFTSHGKESYHTVSYEADDLLVFGSETEGLPSWVHETFPDQCIKIPMLPTSRCLNLSTSVGVAVYEAWRQQSFL